MPESFPFVRIFHQLSSGGDGVRPVSDWNVLRECQRVAVFDQSESSQDSCFPLFTDFELFRVRVDFPPLVLDAAAVRDVIVQRQKDLPNKAVESNGRGVLIRIFHKVREFDLVAVWRFPPVPHLLRCAKDSCELDREFWGVYPAPTETLVAG